jgi:hypothetical protein
VATTPTLRPLGVGEILDAGIKLYLRHWKPLMICVVGIVLPVQIISVLVMASIDSDSLDYAFGTGSASSSQDLSWAEVAAFLSVAIVSFLSTLLATAACFKAVADAWLGSTPDAGRSLKFGLRRLPALVWLSIVVGVCLFFAFLALIVPGIWLLVAWALAVPAMLFERVGPFKSMGRSFRLVRGRWWPTLGALLVAYLLAGIVGGIVQVIPEGIASSAAGDSVVAQALAAVVGGTVSSLITTPYTAAVLTLLYFDGRVRKEGFDLQLLAQGLGATRDPDAPVPAPLVGPDYTPEQRAAAPYWPPPPGWVPPEPSPPASEPDRQWWQDPAPGESATYGGGYARPEPPAGGSGMQSGDPLEGAPAPDEPKRDPDRADWLPPEAPRGPGGL